MTEMSLLLEKKVELWHFSYILHNNLVNNPHLSLKLNNYIR